VKTISSAKYCRKFANSACRSNNLTQNFRLLSLSLMKEICELYRILRRSTIRAFWRLQFFFYSLEDSAKIKIKRSKNYSLANLRRSVIFSYETYVSILPFPGE